MHLDILANTWRALNKNSWSAGTEREKRWGRDVCTSLGRGRAREPVARTEGGAATVNGLGRQGWTARRSGAGPPTGTRRSGGGERRRGQGAGRREARGGRGWEAFQTHNGHYEYKVVSFGLAYAPATFQGAMNATLSPVLRVCALVFFDDILIFSATLEEHLQHLDQVLGLLKKDQWQVKESKCLFAQQQISYLGYRISARAWRQRRTRLKQFVTGQPRRL